MHPVMPCSCSPQRGLSLVELLVGVAIGLFITAAAAMLVSTQIAGNRQLLAETQIQQDLRATADIVTRDLRRASYAANPETFASLPGNPSPPELSWASAIQISAGPDGSSQVEYKYRLDTNVFGLRLSGNVLQRRVGDTWQPLTDVNVLKVTSFTVERDEPDIKVACTNRCIDGTESCWPQAKVRELLITIAGESATGAPVRRRIQNKVRVRNDFVSFNTQTPTQVCP
jgi:type IV pilus assembly protein PilW